VTSKLCRISQATQGKQKDNQYC